MADDFTYSIDTSALIHGWMRVYPITVPMFRPVWDKLNELIENGRLRASAEVFAEIKKKDDDLAAWCEGRPDLFVEIEDDPIQKQVADLLAKYPRLVDTRKGRSGADPFVIAYAMTCNPVRTVVTQEQGGTLERPKIPFVCNAENVR